METDVEVTEDRNGEPLLRKPRTIQLSYACKCWFLRRGEYRSIRGKTSRSRVENQQTQPTYGVEFGNRSWATLVKSKCCHHCASPAPHVNNTLQAIPCGQAESLSSFLTLTIGRSKATLLAGYVNNISRPVSTFPNEFRPFMLHGATPAELFLQRRCTKVSAKSFNM